MGKLDYRFFKSAAVLGTSHDQQKFPPLKLSWIIYHSKRK